MSALIPILAVPLAGIGLAIQPTANAALVMASGSSWLGPLVSCAVGTITPLGISAAADRTMLDRFGLTGLSQQPISLARLAGVALVIGSVVLIRVG